jgi:GGDEF domain-containing protein
MPDPTESGLAPEAALLRRLTVELERAAFQEQDVSVATFRFSFGSRGDEVYARNAWAILQFFSFEDLCFEYGDREVVVIFPGTTLADALGQLERFQRYYWEERYNWNAPDADLAVGVSARNGRLVEGGRVLGECRTALKRAEKSAGRIMGFQPDPQRYRAELLNQSR